MVWDTKDPSSESKMSQIPAITVEKNPCGQEIGKLNTEMAVVGILIVACPWNLLAF